MTVTNDNDNNPKFGRDVYTFNVPENSRDHPVGTVTATDADLANSNALRYNLEYPSRLILSCILFPPIFQVLLLLRIVSLLKITLCVFCSLFAISSTTGAIKTVRALDYETAKQHNFTVEVTDGGPSPRVGRALVIVNVLDIEDSEPLFEISEYNTEFEENKVGQLISVLVSIENQSLSRDVISLMLE